MKFKSFQNGKSGPVTYICRLIRYLRVCMVLSGCAYFVKVKYFFFSSQNGREGLNPTMTRPSRERRTRIQVNRRESSVQ